MTDNLRLEAAEAANRAYPNVFNWQQAQLKSTYTNGYLAHAAKSGAEVEALKAEIEIYRVGGIPLEYATDVVINLCTDKYTKAQKIHTFAALEKQPDLLLQLIKEHQQIFYNPDHPIDGPCVLKFAIIKYLQCF